MVMQFMEKRRTIEIPFLENAKSATFSQSYQLANPDAHLPVLDHIYVTHHVCCMLVCRGNYHRSAEFQFIVVFSNPLRQ